MAEVMVRTKEELKKARNAKVEFIVVEGELADKLKKGKKLAYAGIAGTVGATTIAALMAATPVTGGVSFFAVAPIAALTGFEVAAIIAAASIGLTLLIAVFKDYEEIEARDGMVKLKRRAN
ncbi:hypothetical protein [Budvicia aquatica]|uniref:hypothetical protein n=1 Tax=Budvicia aquatica TaxID=82979 RepID=UPI00208BC018|nr:hypothetical protein [Budvicia aquatica]GKX51545.1 hypothetical protein SOASR029_18540 [Budvicia aquatica]